MPVINNWSSGDTNWSSSNRINNESITYSVDFDISTSFNGEGFSVSFDSINASISGSDLELFSGTHELSDNWSLTRGIIHRTDQIPTINDDTNMPSEPLGTWAFNQMAEYRGVEDAAREVVESARSGAAQSIVESLFESVQTEVGRAVENGDEPARQFNDETIDWSHEMRMRVAGYMLEMDPEWLDSELTNFRSELSNFSSGGGYNPDGENDPIPEDYASIELNENPLESDEYTTDEALAYIIAAVNGEDPSEIDFNDISDLDAFRWWIEEVGDVDEAQRAHHFGTDVPREVARHALPPDEWETLDPDISNNRCECSECLNGFYEVETPTGIISITESGDQYEGRAVNTGDPDSEILSTHVATENEILCPSCYQSTINGEPQADFFAVDASGQVANFGYNNGYVVDYSMTEDIDGTTPINELDDETKMGVLRISSEPSRPRFNDGTEAIDVSPYSSKASSGADDLFYEAGRNGDLAREVFDGPMVGLLGGGRFDPTAFAPATRPPVVGQIKAVFQNPSEYV